MNKNKNQLAYYVFIHKTCPGYNMPVKFKEKLLKVKVNRHGEFDTNSRAYKWTKKHFPTILKRFKELIT